MGQIKEFRGVKTRIRVEGKKTLCRYHWTDVVVFTDKTITLNANGWQTVTTKLRMNQASYQFNLGYYVYQKKGVWYVQTPQGKTVEFKDNMQIKRSV